jgi:hypothetical protein
MEDLNALPVMMDIIMMVQKKCVMNAKKKVVLVQWQMTAEDA